MSPASCPPSSKAILRPPSSSCRWFTRSCASWQRKSWSGEKPGQTLQATALVHEAYLRLVGADMVQSWDSRRHFFAAAAEAMRRILVEKARRKRSVKHGGQRTRIDLDEALVVGDEPRAELLELDELLEQLAGADPRAAELVKLRFFGGLTGEHTAEVLGISPRAADLLWAYARAWLFEKLQRQIQ